MAIPKTMEDRDGLIWFNDKFVPWREAKTHVLTHTLHYGLGVFEGVRAYETKKGPAIFRLEDHTKRLFNSAHIVGMELPFTSEQVNKAQKDSIRKNNLKSGYIRPMAFYGAEEMGISATKLSTNLIVAAWSWGAYMGQEALDSGIKVKTSSLSRHHVNSTMTKAKANGNYMNSILAHQEATNDGYDEALLLDTQGFIAEGTGENIFIVKNNKLFTPTLTSALEGITRDTVISIANGLNVEIIEKSITRDEVYCADEAFFTGTAAEVTPIKELDGRKIGKGSRGPLTKEIQKIYFDTVKGLNPDYEHWLRYVDEK